ncbi:MAG: peptidylprolyl isomerase [Flavobacteriales bacterium]
MNVLCSCKQTFSNKFHNESIRHIATLADLRDTESLMPYLQHADPILREEAAMAFASIRDTLAISSLWVCLNDSIPEVRAAAAYSIGQMPHLVSLRKIPEYLDQESDSLTYHQLAEAMGKIIGQFHSDTLQALAINTAIESLLAIKPAAINPIAARARAAFWMNMGGFKPQKICHSLSAAFTTANVNTRRCIAFALGRCKGDWLNDTLSTSAFLHALGEEKDTMTMLAGLSVAGKVKSEIAAELIRKTLSENPLPHETLIAACRAAGRNEAIIVKEILPILDSKFEPLLDEALNALESKSPTAEDWEQLLKREEQFSSRILAHSMRLKCIWFANFGLKTPAVFGSFKGLPEQECIQKIEKEIDVYTRLEWIRTLGMSPSMADHIYQKAMASSQILEMNAYTEAFIMCSKQALIPKATRYAESLMELCNKHDVGVTALCAAELRELPITEEEKKKFTEQLESHLETLAIPMQVETANELIRTINKWGIKTLEEIKVPHNHPLDWEWIQKIPRQQQAIITTNRGSITIELHVEQAPGSVASFIQLAKSGFYNGKTFHRMVPNFVVQGGCPRGDGMGSTDYSLRSEFQLHDYRAGSVGLASSGPDTESCQWFITHIPTPHLEGRYTIFAHVIQGMEVVIASQIGDEIRTIVMR